MTRRFIVFNAESKQYHPYPISLTTAQSPTCPHLVYLGKGGGFDKNRPEYCKFYDELMQVGSENYLQTLREELN